MSPPPLEAAFDILDDHNDLKIRLLWLNLPEKISVSPKIGVINGREPIPEAIFTVLQVTPRGDLEFYPAPF